MFYTSSTDPNMFVICASDSDSKVEALKNIVYATGTYRTLSWSRIYSASEYKKVYDYGHDVMADYVSARQHRRDNVRTSYQFYTPGSISLVDFGCCGKSKSERFFASNFQIRRQCLDMF